MERVTNWQYKFIGFGSIIMAYLFLFSVWTFETRIGGYLFMFLYGCLALSISYQKEIKRLFK